MQSPEIAVVSVQRGQSMRYGAEALRAPNRRRTLSPTREELRESPHLQAGVATLREERAEQERT